MAVRDDNAPDSFVYGRRDDVLAFAAQVADERGLDQVVQKSPRRRDLLGLRRL